MAESLLWGLFAETSKQAVRPSGSEWGDELGGEGAGGSVFLSSHKT